MLCLLCCFLQALQSHAILGQVDAVFLLELINKVLDDTMVEIFTAEEGVTIGGANFYDVVTDFENRDIESTTAEVEDSDLLVGLLVETVRQRSRSRLVDDTLDFKTGDLASILGSLTLGIVEICRDGDDSLGHLFTQVGFGVLLELLKDHGGNFRRAVLLAVDVYPRVITVTGNDFVRAVCFPLIDFRRFHVATHKALDGKNGFLGVGYGLALGNITNQTFLVSEGDNRRRRTSPFGVADAFRVFTFHDVNTGVGGSKVDPYDLAHVCVLLIRY